MIYKVEINQEVRLYLGLCFLDLVFVYVLEDLFQLS